MWEISFITPLIPKSSTFKRIYLRLLLDTVNLCQLTKFYWYHPVVKNNLGNQCWTTRLTCMYSVSLLWCLGRSQAAGTLTEAGGFGRVPLAQFSAMADVHALQDEAGVAAVVEHRSLHRRPRRLGRHAAVLQGRPHPRAQQHWEPGGKRGDTGS